MNQAPSPSRRAALAASLGAFALLATGCGRRDALSELPAAAEQAFGGLSMGSTYTVKLAAPGLSARTVAAAREAVAAALGEVVGLMSHYESDSELARLNHHPVGRPFAVSAATLAVFEVAHAVQLASQGAFDVTIGRTVDAWGFGPSGQRQQPLATPLRQALLAQQRADALLLDPRNGTITRQAPVLANLSGIAKGHGVDRAARALDALGLDGYMIEVGGEIRTRGRHADGRPWRLAIERPDAMPQRPLLLLPLQDRALATSGDYRNFFMHEGRRYSHEIDPASAAPVTHALASVSVVADDCTLADAWSTALFVLGPERGFETASRLGLAAYFVNRRADGAFSEASTTAFAALGARAAG